MFLGLLLALYRLLWHFERVADTRVDEFLPLLHAATYWLITLLAAWELSWQVGQHLAGVWRQLSWGLVPAALLAVLAARRLRPDWPLARHVRIYRGLAALPLAVFVALWVLAINLSSSGGADPLVYLPLLNPLDLSVALCLAALLHYGLAIGLAEPGRLRPDPRALLLAVAAALVFLWLNAALLRALHHRLGTPLNLHGIAHSTLVQAALSVFWGLLGFGAMILASRRGWRAAWSAGAALMAVVVLKLFLVDTAGRGTLARIVSFLTVGVLLLVTGYLSPLPPPRREEPAP